MKYKMKYRFKSLRFKIIVLVLLFSAVIAVFSALISYHITKIYLKETQQQSAYINVQLIGSEINTDLRTALNFSNWLLLDPYVESYLKNSGEDDKNTAEYRKIRMDIWKHLNDEYNLSAYHDIISRFVVSDTEGTDFIHITRTTDYSAFNIPERVMSMEGFDDMLGSKGYLFTGLTQSPLNPGNGQKVLPIVRSVKSSNSPVTIGWIYIEISEEAITRHISNIDLEEDSELYLSFGDNNTYIYKDNRFINSPLPDGLVSYVLSDEGITLSLLPSKAELRQRSRDQFIMIIFILVFISISGIVIYILLRQMISIPVDALLAKLTKVGAGDFGRDPAIEWDNEFGEIGRGINRLSDNVDALINSKLEDERTKQLLEYRILQSQINPHFMYNTLNTIKWMAAIQGAEGIADISTALSRLLKNVSRVKDNLIPLKDEKALLDDYFTIMKYRYGGAIELEYDIEDTELLKCMVNRFSLQPIVENAIFHGIEPKGSAGRITVHIFSLEKDLHIDVTDNGVGMDESAISRLFCSDNSSSNDFFMGVGISNVSERIRFTFGKEYGLTAESEPGRYTTIHIKIPLRPEETDKKDEIPLSSI